MLQSPKKKTQRPRRLTSVTENPILEAKQDNKRQLQQQQQSRQPQVPASYPTPSRHREGYRGQHRRHYSVPDLMMVGSASPRLSSGHVYQARNMENLEIDVNCGHDQPHLTIDNFNFCTLQPQRPQTPPNQHTGGKQPNYSYYVTRSLLLTRILSSYSPNSIRMLPGRKPGCGTNDRRFIV